MANIESSVCGGRLLIVLNGIEIRNNNPKKLLHILLIVLNGIEIHYQSASQPNQSAF